MPPSVPGGPGGEQPPQEVGTVPVGPGAVDDSSGDDGSSNADGDASGGDATAPAGKFVGTIPSPAGGANITGGGTGGVGGAGTPLGAGYTIASAGSAGRGGFSDLAAFFGNAGGFPGGGGAANILTELRQLNAAHERLIALTRIAPAATGGHLSNALNGVSRSAYNAGFSSGGVGSPW
ncbi:MAG TPA: hypothetical protein VHZ03_23645 [Trebonia sp.]|nr:hypothetical protein [Trebonia sp.]